MLSRCIIFETKFKGNVLSKPEGSWEYCKNVCGKRILGTKYSRGLLICVRGMRPSSWWSMNFDLKFVTSVQAKLDQWHNWMGIYICLWRAYVSCVKGILMLYYWQQQLVTAYTYWCGHNSAVTVVGFTSADPILNFEFIANNHDRTSSLYGANCTRKLNLLTLVLSIIQTPHNLFSLVSVQSQL